MGLVIFIWLTSAIIAAIIGSKKGNPIAGLFIGLIFGPLGVLAAILSEDKNRIPCPYCAEKILKAARICPHCQKTVSDY